MAHSGCPGWVFSNANKMRAALGGGRDDLDLDATGVLVALKDTYGSPLLHGVWEEEWPKADYKAPRRVLAAILDTLDLVCCAVPYAFDFVHADATTIVAGVAKKVKVLRLHGPRDVAEVLKHTSAALIFGQALVNVRNRQLLDTLAPLHSYLLELGSKSRDGRPRAMNYDDVWALGAWPRDFDVKRHQLAVPYIGAGKAGLAARAEVHLVPRGSSSSSSSYVHVTAVDKYVRVVEMEANYMTMSCAAEALLCVSEERSAFFSTISNRADFALEAPLGSGAFGYLASAECTEYYNIDKALKNRWPPQMKAVASELAKHGDDRFKLELKVHQKGPKLNDYFDDEWFDDFGRAVFANRSYMTEVFSFWRAVRDIPLESMFARAHTTARIPLFYELGGAMDRILGQFGEIPGNLRKIRVGSRVLYRSEFALPCFEFLPKEAARVKRRAGAGGTGRKGEIPDKKEAQRIEYSLYDAMILSLFVDAKAARAVRDWAVSKLAAIELAHASRGGRYKQATIDLLRILSQSTIADPPRTRDYGT